MPTQDTWINAIPAEAVAAVRLELSPTDDSFTDNDIKRAVFEAIRAMDDQAVLAQREAERTWNEVNLKILERENQPRPSDYDLRYGALAVASGMVDTRRTPGEKLAELTKLADSIRPLLSGD